MTDYGFDTEDDSMIETVEDWNDADIERKKYMETYMSDSGEAQEEQELKPEEPPEDRDASVELLVQDDKMSATIYINEPTGQGLDVTRQDILDALAEKNITYGVNSARINEIVEDKAYRQLFNIAEGKEPIDGKNGRIKDYFPRKHQLKFAQTANGGIDFKNMNLIHNVKKGDLVCEITYPEEALDGIDIFGNAVHGKRGKMPPIPQGRNIVFSEKKDKLLTACEGNLSFRSGRFHVENVYQVGGNVDNSVGNINFSGSVYIHGDVFEGYTVKAKGDITVVGMVEGAELSAGGDILLHKGMRGMKTGLLRAGGSITGKFLEDCTIYARENVEAEYIINSKVSCEQDVILTGRRGAFIGGSCAVLRTMKVRTVGAMSHIPTDVTLGVTPELLEKMNKTKAELGEVTKKLMACKKDMDYLTLKLKSDTITQSQKNKLKELKIQEPVNQMLLKQLREKLGEISRQLREVGKSRLVVETVHAGTTIHIGEAALSIKKQEDNCTFYYMDGEIKRGLR